jgi:hypothetical protein
MGRFVRPRFFSSCCATDGKSQPWRDAVTTVSRGEDAGPLRLEGEAVPGERPHVVVHEPRRGVHSSISLSNA